MGQRVLVGTVPDADRISVKNNLSAAGAESVKEPTPELPDVFVVTLPNQTDSEAFLQRLIARGLPARSGSGGSVLIKVGDDSPYDAVRDAAAELGVGLMRVARRRDRLEDLFQVTEDDVARTQHG